jgi:putative DNA primase/helicase
MVTMIAVNETEILQNLFIELDLANWMVDLQEQPKNYTGWKREKAEESIPRTDIKAARAIRNKFENRLSYVEASDTWYVWNGMVHVPCVGDSVAYKVIKFYYGAMEDALTFYKGGIDVLATHAASSGNKDAAEKAKKIRELYEKGEIAKHRRYRDRISGDAGVKSLLAVLKTELDIPANYFDGDLDFLVVRNGVIDIKQFKADGFPTLLPHDPARPVWRYVDADYDQHAQAPSWNQFLNSSIIDAETATLLQKGVGAAFAGTYKPRAMFNLLGAPASGKSLFLSVFDKLGQNYSVMPNNQAIQVNNGDTNFYQDALRGKRFVGFSEVQGKKALDDGFIKGIMGGDKQNTRQMRQMESPWTPQCVMFVASNMALKVDFRDEATFNKVLPIPFPWSFTDVDPEHKLDRDLEDKVLAERNGVLLWVLIGMKKFWEEGLAPTKAVMEAMGENKVASSYALQFVKDLIDTGYIEQDLSAKASSFVKMGDAYKAFTHWAEAQGVKNVPGKHTFNDDIKQAYFGDIPSGGRRFKGLKMSATFEGLIVDPQRMAFHMGNLEERLELNN